MLRSCLLNLLFVALPMITVLLGASLSSSLDFDYTHMIFHFRGEDTTSWIGSVLKNLGDINADGYDDIAFSSRSPKGIYLFFGGQPVDSQPDYFLQNVFTVGEYLDYNGDGDADLVTSAVGVIYLYQGFGDSIASQPVDSIVAPRGYNYYLFRESGDLDNNSIGDLFVTADDPYEGSVALLYYDAFAADRLPDWVYTIENHSHWFGNSGLVDFNGDGHEDIFLSLAAYLATSGYVYIFLGPTFSSEPDIIFGSPVGFDHFDTVYFAKNSYSIGDINGDGWDDLGVLAWSTPLVYLGGPEADTIYDYELDGHCSYMAEAGDINGDGYNDLVIGGSDTWNGRVILYLGGPQFDTYRDDQIDRGDLPPLFLDEIGRRVSSAGDFNGDGYDDILFTCGNFAHGEPRDVFIFSGGDDITVDVEYDSDDQLPDGFILRQNYPNPFNQSTIIEFELPRRDVINLYIYDILGRKVRTLLSDKTFSAGKHGISWDGTFQSGDSAPSGIYFFRISGEAVSASKSMILLK